MTTLARIVALHLEVFPFTHGRFETFARAHPQAVVAPRAACPPAGATTLRAFLQRFVRSPRHSRQAESRPKNEPAHPSENLHAS